MELLPVAGDDEQRVVDADAEPDHDADERGEVGHLEQVAEENDQRAADADAEQRDPDGQAHCEDRPERDDEDDDREGESEDLRVPVVEIGEDEATPLDL